MGVPPQIELGNLGMADSLILMILALVVFGPRRLPQIGRQIGKLMYEFRKASNDFKFQMEEEMRLAEDAERRKKEEAERARNLALNPPAVAAPVEAEASIGADDQASVSAPPPGPSSYSPEGTASAASETTASAEPVEEHVRYPRISPPSTGEQVATSRPGSGISSETAAIPAEVDPAIAAEANIGADPGPSNGRHGSGEAAASEATSETSRSETVTHHG